MKESVVNPREKYIDVIAGIMITWMILCHCMFFSHQSFPLRKFLGFYMPWFFYKSGLFFTSKNPKLLIQKDSNKLLKTFFVYSLVGWVIWCICGLTDGSLVLTDCFLKPISSFFLSGTIKGNNALWFLLTLFLVRQISNILINKELPPPVLSIVAFGIAFLLYVLDWHETSWWFGNLFSGLCFFILGYWLKEKETNKWLFIASTIFFIFVVAMYFGGWIEGFPYLYMHANKMYSGNYFLFYPLAFAGIIMTNNIFRFLCKHIKFRILEYIEVNSMTFYTTHWILFVIATFTARYFFGVNNPKVMFFLLLGSSAIFLPIINEIIKSLKLKTVNLKTNTI